MTPHNALFDQLPLFIFEIEPPNTILMIHIYNPIKQLNMNYFSVKFSVCMLGFCVHLTD